MAELPPFNNPPPSSEPVPTQDNLPTAAVTGSEPVEPSTPPARWRGARLTLAWILRWAILGAGIGGAWLFGVLVAQFFPAPNPEPPVQEVIARKTSGFWQKLGRLPEWWANDDLGTGPPPATLSSGPEENPPTALPPTRPIALTDAQRQQVEVELDAIANDVQQLRDRTSAVERQLGLPPIDMPIEERLSNATDRLSPPTTATQPPPPDPSSTLQPATGAVPDPLFQVNAAYRATLPSDVLFAPGQSMLQPNARPLLDNILQDIARYPEATIVVGSYTDADIAGTTPTELSYQQAIAVQRYLDQRLGRESIHWVPVGYGNSNIGSTGGVQLSRRITIAIVP